MRARLGVFELALLIEKAWSNGLDSEEIDVSLNYYEAKRELEEKSRGFWRRTIIRPSGVPLIPYMTAATAAHALLLSLGGLMAVRRALMHLTKL